ncbi:MAG: hypothetical protein JSV85_03125 [Candidatus Bathyarchaeota archaeon]|nr:MAG: hypothetical protein JSV85_03125 [Candidatus Bathyarchaeota archaeon]
MGKIQVKVRTGFGEIIVEGTSAEEILGLLGSMSSEFMGEVSGLVSAKTASPLKTQLEGIIELTTEGPIITTRQKLTHYEAIGLTLYTSEEKSNTATQIARLLASGGIKSMVPARLNEMTKRGMVFKPNPSRPKFRLTSQGERWIEEKVLTKLQGVKE